MHPRGLSFRLHDLQNWCSVSDHSTEANDQFILSCLLRQVQADGLHRQASLYIVHQALFSCSSACMHYCRLSAGSQAPIFRLQVKVYHGLLEGWAAMGEGDRRQGQQRLGGSGLQLVARAFTDLLAEVARAAAPADLPCRDPGQPEVANSRPHRPCLSGGPSGRTRCHWMLVCSFSHTSCLR